jgi:hypothetical protein
MAPDHSQSPLPQTATAPPGAEESDPEPSASTDTVAGYDSRQIWELCKERGTGPGNPSEIITDEYNPADVKPAFNGDGVQVVVSWRTATDNSIHYFGCAFDGSTSAPVLYSFDVPHEGK